MAEYPELSHVDLANHSGRPVSSYDPVFSATAISQATLLFKIGTCLTALPEPPSVAYDLAVTAIKAMADQIVLAQPYVETQASPFTSETIGSYSYSKMAQQVMSKDRTGVMWFDLAVQELSVCDENDQAFFFGGVEILEHSGRFDDGSLGEGNIRFLSDSDLASHHRYLKSTYPDDPYSHLEG